MVFCQLAVFFQLDMQRFLQVYIVQGAVGLIWAIIAYRILARGRKRLNVMLSLFYLFGILGVILNFIYAPLTNESAVYILNFLTNFCFFFAPIFLVVFEILLLKSNKIFGTYKQLIIIIVYGALLCGVLFIPDGIKINAGTNWKPVWSVPYFIYAVVVSSIFGLIPLFYFGFKIYDKFKDETLKKKWKFFIIGTVAIAIFTYGTYISNTLNMDTFRMIWSFAALSLTIGGPILLYYGVGKQV
jgi:hypothetical protein